MHDSWARHYDFVYDECFGRAFWRLTAETLAVVTETRATPARVLDLGAGTGRLAVPLALLGYDVTAVESSPGMADMLDRKAAEHGAEVHVQRVDLRDLTRASAPRTDAGGYDLVLATFTVLNYLVADEDVDALARFVSAQLAPGGRFVFDIAARRLFASALFESERLHREIEVRQLSPSLFEYRDAGCGTDQGHWFHYDEKFTFRYWRIEEVLEHFARYGLRLETEVTPRLRESGSRWFVIAR